MHDSIGGSLQGLVGRRWAVFGVGQKKREYRIQTLKDLPPEKLRNSSTENFNFSFQYLFSGMDLGLIRKTGVGPDSVQQRCPPPLIQVVRLGEVCLLIRGPT